MPWKYVNTHPNAIRWATSSACQCSSGLKYVCTNRELTRRIAKQIFQTDSSDHASSSDPIGDRTLVAFAADPSVVAADAWEASKGSGSFDLDLRFSPWKGTERRFVWRKSMILYSCIETDPLTRDNPSALQRNLHSINHAFAFWEWEYTQYSSKFSNSLSNIDHKTAILLTTQR
jgi:hypothetical protein